MQNLAAVPANKNLYRFRDRPDGEVVEVEVQYRKGSSPRTRGIYLLVHPASISGEIRVQPLLTGHQALVCTAERASPSLLRRFAEAADARAPLLAEKYRADPDGEGRTTFEALARDLASATQTMDSSGRSSAGGTGV